MKLEPRRSPGRPRINEGYESPMESILQTAGALFLEKGYEHVSVNTVAQACNITKPKSRGTNYKRFGTSVCSSK